jgi:hypothetical protein
MTKTHSLEQDGISVFGAASAARAKRMWTEARDAFARHAACNPTWVFHYKGNIVVVTAVPDDNWEYVIIPANAETNGPATGQCIYRADDRRDAIKVALTELAGRIWTPDQDEGALYDDIMRAAGDPEYIVWTRRAST